MIDIEQIQKQMQVVVLMGGLGTRLGEWAKGLPKAMVDVNGRPFFDYQLMLLKKWGFRRFLFLVGYKSEQIEQYYGDGYSQGLEITYSYDGEKQLGTGGALRKAAEYLDDDFLLIYGDSFMDINYFETVYRYFHARENGAMGLMTILHNCGSYDKSNVALRENGMIYYDKRDPSLDMDYIDYGVSVFCKRMIMEYEPGVCFDLSVAQHELSEKGLLAAQIVTKRFYEIGSPASYEEFISYAKKRFDVPSKALFLDRDGVINEIIYNDATEQLDSPMKVSEFKFKEGILDTLKVAENKGYLLFIVTNQPAAAKGKTALIDLFDINTHMLSEFKENGIDMECVEACFHHPKGSPKAKDSFLIRECGCRKPKVGLFENVRQIYSIDWEHSYMIGDSYTDVLAGRAWGLNTIFLGELKCDICARLSYDKPDIIIDSLDKLEAVIA